MTTLIAITNIAGLRRQCHAECYSAKGNHCTCICRGVNHGVGLHQALLNTRQMHAQWLAAAEAERTDDLPLSADVPALLPNARQTDLWPPQDLVI